MLDPLGPQINGGPTPTIALLPKSPAIDAGDPSAPARDQRYYMRNGAPDIGAFEYQGTLAPLRAVSRKTHGVTATFDVDLPLSGESGIECRSGGVNGQHRIVLDFSTPIVFQSASIVTGIGEVLDANVSGSEATADLTGVVNDQEIVLRLSGVNDGAHQSNVDIPIRLLLGDVNASSAVNASDVTVIKRQLAQPVTNLNFREDVNASGAIDASDLALVKSQLGMAAP